MRRRHGPGGHPNGYCELCGDPAASLEADYCSSSCRSRAAAMEARAEQYERQAEELARARATAEPDERDE